MAQDTAQAKQHTEQAHRLTGGKWPRTPHTQHNKPRGHTGEQEPSSQDTEQAKQHNERVHW